MNLFIAVAGLTGAGKSTVCDYLKEEKGFGFVRFGQITLDLAKERFGSVNQEKERIIREEIREKQGMAAYAILNMPKFNAALENGNLVGDDLMSFEEYLYLKEKFGKQLVLIAVVSGQDFRYNRLNSRAVAVDPKMRFRNHTLEEAKNRDLTQLTNVNQGPSIALAEYFIINQGNKENVIAQTEELLNWIKKRED